jgi:IS1 family transposase
MELAMNQLSYEKKIQVLNALVEGNSLRSITRMLDVHRTTVMRVLIEAGELARKVLDESIMNLNCNHIQCDEIWCFVGKKQRQCSNLEKRQGELGDQYIFVAMDSETKLVISYLVGKRSLDNAIRIMKDLKQRVSNRFQLTTDSFRGYSYAVETVLRYKADYAQLHKVYDETIEGQKRYSPARIIRVIPKPIIGNPDPEKISTSYVERQNLTMRMSMRRLTRLTNAFSKKLYNLQCAIDLHFFYYNFMRIHQTLRVTPAMQSGVTKHLWNWENLLGIVERRKVA